MKPGKDSFVILASTGLLAFLVVTVSLTGILISDFYSKETLSWQIQSLGQDMIDLFLITPALIVTGIIAAKRNRTGVLLWAGVLVYIIYTFIIYCFSVHFNSLFPVYCLILCLSFYSFLWSIYKQRQNPATTNPISKSTIKITGIYFILIALLFYFLWLAEIIPSIAKNTSPESLKQSGLPTNPVHVLDLSFFLPAILIAGVFILRKNQAASRFGVVLLGFFLLMDITIGWLAFRMNQEGLGSNHLVEIAMTLLAATSIILLFLNLRIKKEKRTVLLNEPSVRFDIKTNSSN